jgi:predicted nucleotidyltransferase
MVFYRLAADHPAIPDLTNLLIKTVAFGDVLKAGLEKSPLEIKCAFIYGSYAKGTPNSNSDIDLFVLSDASLLDLSSRINPIMERTGREVNIVSITPNEFRKRHKEKNRFTLELLSCQKIWLIGSDDEFKTLVG